MSDLTREIYKEKGQNVMYRTRKNLINVYNRKPIKQNGYGSLYKAKFGAYLVSCPDMQIITFSIKDAEKILEDFYRYGNERW